MSGRLPFDAGSESYHCERHGHCLLDASSLGPFLENIAGCSRGLPLSSLRWVVELSLTSIVAEDVLEQAELRDIVNDGLKSVRSMRDFSSLFHSAIFVKADALFYVVDVYEVFSASKSRECSIV